MSMNQSSHNHSCISIKNRRITSLENINISHCVSKYYIILSMFVKGTKVSLFCMHVYFTYNFYRSSRTTMLKNYTSKRVKYLTSLVKKYEYPWHAFHRRECKLYLLRYFSQRAWVAELFASPSFHASLFV